MSLNDKLADYGTSMRVESERLVREAAAVRSRGVADAAAWQDAEGAAQVRKEAELLADSMLATSKTLARKAKAAIDKGILLITDADLVDASFMELADGLFQECRAQRRIVYEPPVGGTVSDGAAVLTGVKRSVKTDAG